MSVLIDDAAQAWVSAYVGRFGRDWAPRAPVAAMNRCCQAGSVAGATAKTVRQRHRRMSEDSAANQKRVPV
jgi:hypothetical protein